MATSGLSKAPQRFSREKALSGLLFVSALFPSISFGQTHPANEPRCTWEGVGAEYRVPPQVLYAIARVESGLNPSAVNRANRNGSIDTGLMQINSVHWSTLSKYSIQPGHLYDSCTNLRVGAWVLANNLVRARGDIWRAIDLYNPGDKTYRYKVYRQLKAINAIAE